MDHIKGPIVEAELFRLTMILLHNSLVAESNSHLDSTKLSFPMKVFTPFVKKSIVASPSASQSQAVLHSHSL